MKISKYLLVLAILLAPGAYASELCIKDIGNANYILATCLEALGLSRSTFVGKAHQKTSFEYLDVTVVTAKGKHEFLSLNGDKDGTVQAAAKSLPQADAIERREPLNTVAARLLAIKGWSAKGEKIDYYSVKETPGFSLVCGSASRKIRSIYVRVSQCTSFYEEDITAFHEILKTVEKDIEARPR
ncbi:hypothetical protein [Pseudomonas aeruginosa]|uniref:hypothetical protein n=1 Tax=Pseudomonas aeruginosa TaxID=287 RepID=UPI000F819C0F|nr:hypothetical protein [Pseudomonas aeruginosa]MBG4883740.1 hypothetical protein [Pseudomonas aeruginosa]MBI7254325.1 hypothetical protein [Pseudomonas aeruginosa]MBI7735764.1 hypothetical protein [Pseudomonas aeruginosa]MBI8560605.1 hypothetical protein [Pseudomonas aeruginosa]MBV5585752.1 hypothetical protein [Pseudomonas aeruginosa]